MNDSNAQQPAGPHCSRFSGIHPFAGQSSWSVVNEVWTPLEKSPIWNGDEFESVEDELHDAGYSFAYALGVKGRDFPRAELYRMVRLTPVTELYPYHVAVDLDRLEMWSFLVDCLAT